MSWAPMSGGSPDPTLLDHIGRTPLLPLRRLARFAGLPEGTTLLAKVESLNPGGSCKDRIAVALVEAAEQDGLRPGGIVVEATSGNTGIALAQVCAIKGYRLHVVCSEKVCDEKMRIIEAFGGTVHRTPNVPHGHPDHYTEVAPRLAEELGGHYLDQFHSDQNARVHHDHTAPEILHEAAALGLTVDALVVGVGTGGTLRGLSSHFAHASPATRIVLADPEGSVLAASAPRSSDGVSAATGPSSGGRGTDASAALSPAPYLVEGIGDDVPPPLFDGVPVHDAATVSDHESFRTARLAARLEGLLVGGSSGTHLAAAIAVARRLPAGSTVCTVLPDTGRNYLSTFLDPAWCDANGVPIDAEEEARPDGAPAASDPVPAAADTTPLSETEAVRTAAPSAQRPNEEEVVWA